MWDGLYIFAFEKIGFHATAVRIDLDVETKGEGIRHRRTRVSVQAAGGKTSRQEHVYRRNRELIARYYYWTEIRRRRFDDVMRILSEEFHVEDRTISNALLDFGDYLDGLYKGKKDIRELKKEYPYRNWENWKSGASVTPLFYWYSSKVVP